MTATLCPPIPTAAPDFRRIVGKISRQSTVFFAGTIFSSAAGYFFKVYLARVMGAEALGVYALGMTIVGFVGVIGAVGLPQTASRFVAVYSSTGQTRKLASFLCSSIVVLCVTNLLAGWALVSGRRWFAVRFYHTPALSALMPYFVAILFIGALTGFCGQCLAGYKDVAKRTMITNFVGTPLTMILSVAMLAVGWGLRGYLAAQISSALFVLVLLGSATWRLTTEKVHLVVWGPSSFGLEREVVSFSSVLFAIQGLEFLSSQADKVLLGVWLTAREVGIYSAAIALVAFVPIVLQSINQIFAPTIADLYANGRKELLLRLYQTLTKWTLSLTIPLAIVMIVFARPLMGIFGPEFASGWPVLVIATVGQLVNCGVGSVGQLLVMSGHQRRMIRAQSIVVPVVLILGFIAIPILGLVGAALLGAVANVLLNMLMLRDVKKTLSFYPSPQNFSLILPAVLTLCSVYFVRAATVTLQSRLVSVFIALLVAYFTFALSASKTALDDDDKFLAMNAWREFRMLLN